MKAVVFHKPGDMRVDKVADPEIEQPDDILLGLSIDEAPYAYHIFKNKEDDCVKVVLQP